MGKKYFESDGNNYGVLRINKSESYITFKIFTDKGSCYVYFEGKGKKIKKIRDILQIPENVCNNCKKPICPHCKVVLEGKGSFCSNCGGKVTE